MVSGRRWPRREVSGTGCGRESAQRERLSSCVSVAVATLAGDAADSRDIQHSASRRQCRRGETEVNAGRVEEFGGIRGGEQKSEDRGQDTSKIGRGARRRGGWVFECGDHAGPVA